VAKNNNQFAIVFDGALVSKEYVVKLWKTEAKLRHDAFHLKAWEEGGERICLHH
jgi:hypothetical protein